MSQSGKSAPRRHKFAMGGIAKARLGMIRKQTKDKGALKKNVYY